MRFNFANHRGRALRGVYYGLFQVVNGSVCKTTAALTESHPAPGKPAERQKPYSLGWGRVELH